jgi:hypothetical protein
MLDHLFEKFEGKALQSIAMVTGLSANIIKAIEHEFQEKPEHRNIALDAIIAILEKAKTK